MDMLVLKLHGYMNHLMAEKPYLGDHSETMILVIENKFDNVYCEMVDGNNIASQSLVFLEIKICLTIFYPIKIFIPVCFSA